jgi:hypothetical protein
VEEALSFGWIDSKVNAIDEERYMQIFTPRKLGSIWSKLNKERIKKVIKEGLMTPAGFEKIEAAKKPSNISCLGRAKNYVFCGCEISFRQHKKIQRIVERMVRGILENAVKTVSFDATNTSCLYASHFLTRKKRKAFDL